MKRNRRSSPLTVLFVLVLPWLGWSQQVDFETDWYRPERPYLKLQVVEDGIYRVNMNELAAFIPSGSADAASLRLFENGREVPIDYYGESTTIASSDYFLFVGRANTAEDEVWNYNYDASLQIDDQFSLYTDTTTYFLTWGAESGLRYTDATSEVANADTVTTYPAVARWQERNIYSFGSSSEVGNPLYTTGEAYMTRLFNHPDYGVVDLTRNVDFRDLPRTDTDSMHVEAAFFGASANSHRVILAARLDYGEGYIFTGLDSLEFEGYTVVRLKGTVPQTVVRRTNSGAVRFSVSSDKNEGEVPSRLYMHHLLARYRATLSIDEGQVGFVADRTGPTVYQFVSELDGEMVVLQPGAATRYSLPVDGSLSDQTEAGEEYWASAVDQFKTPHVLPDNSSDLANTNAAYDYIIVAAPGLMESAQLLKQYRESAEGGGYRVLLANVQDVFDQFDYGRPTPIAIARLIDHSKNWSVAPEFLTLWGDALYPDPVRPRHDWEVPSFGNASSDGWLAMYSQGNPRDYFESISLGRLPLRLNSHGEIFVEKLRAYEHADLSDWQKQVTLMAGGTSDLEQRLLHSSTRDWGTQISEGHFGADVTYFLKSEDSALDPTFLDSVDAAIARGTSWLAFFGHSAADSWEIVTTPPTSFNNSGSLPVAVSLGCFTGAFARGTGESTDSPVYAELLVTESENGAIAHFGGSTSSLISSARSLAGSLYDVVFDQGERTLGTAVRVTKRRYLEQYGASILTVETASQYNLVGDPATRLALPSRPDFDVDARSLLIKPTAPVAGLDSMLTVTVEVRNRGTRPEDSVSVTLIHLSPSNVRTEYSASLAPFALAADTSFEIPLGETDLGDHRFTLSVDPAFEIEEEVETNNTAEKTHTVFTSGVIQLFPSNFGLVTSRQPTLQVGAASTSGDELNVFVELDTVSTFDSPLLVRDEIRLESVASWNPPAPLRNSQSYHWRVRVDDQTLETNWITSSFTVREDLPATGWLQQGSQFANNTHGRFIEYAGNRWRFKQFTVQLLLRSAVHLGEPLFSSISVSGVNYLRNAQGFGVVILDSRGSIKEGGEGSFILYKHRNEDIDPEAELARLDSLLSTVEEGDYVLVNTFLRRVADDAEGILEGGVELFRNLGSTKIDSVGFLDMWNFVTQVGAPEPLLDRWVDYVPDVTELNQTDLLDLAINFGASESVSPPIGPATSWGRVQWSSQISSRRGSLEVAVLSDAGDTLATSRLASPGGTAMIDLAEGPTALDADEHPFIQLVGKFSDPSLAATPQLRNWYVGFESVPELTILASGLDTEPDTLAEGDIYEPSVTVINAAGASVDSIFVTYDVTDAKNVTSRAYVDTLLNVPANTSLESSALVETFGLVGRNQVTVTVRQPDLREPIPYNNTAFGYFFVSGDSEPPLFNITVDGIEYPSDPRDINTTDDPTLPFLSAKPTFVITVSDENEFRPLSDSSVVTILLDEQRVSYARPDILFEPAGDDDNEARLTFSPDFTGEDTTHTMKIYAQDQAGNFNPSKEDPYTFSFRVQTEAEVENLYPYPNPMNNFTTFMFKLRGADPSLVEDLRIRLYTISGRVVREFDLINEPSLLEAGGLQIGWNRVPWDGRDSDGDLLANGVYLYKVFLRAEGEELMVNNETGIEKIAIIR